MSRAPAKINLTLHVLGRRPDGYHDIESAVVFAGTADVLSLIPGQDLSLTVAGPTAGAAGPPDCNLVIRAAKALAGQRPGVSMGAFHLVKRLPAAAGIGGGSSDAAAALRLLARSNDVPLDDPDIIAAARATGADVPVCLQPRARMMRGVGEKVGPSLSLPPLFAVLVNPGVAVPTADVFRGLGLAPGQRCEGAPHPAIDESGTAPEAGRPGEPPCPGGFGKPPVEAAGRRREVEGGGTGLLYALETARNDLEPPALALAPVIGTALARLRVLLGCRLARMSGSGATVFGLFDDGRSATRAAQSLRAAEPGWWVKATVLR